MNASGDDKLLKAGPIMAPFQGFLLALSFLTRFPVNVKYAGDTAVWKWSTAFYPLCGAVLGIFAMLPLFIAAVVAPPNISLRIILITPFIYVALLQWFTRMLHFDGFCDCCDAFTAMSASKERRLEIMKDCHVGSSAIGGAILLLLGKTMALYLLITANSFISNNITALILPLIAIPVFARFAIVCLAAIGTYPRKTGTGALIVGNVPFYSLFIATVTVIPVFWLIFKYFSIYTMLLCFFVTAFGVFYWKIKSGHKIGGVTGDVLGACSETTEFSIAIAFLIS